jgi:recA bacterial DNA recombination protein
MANTSLARSISFGTPASVLASVRERPKFLPLQVPGLKPIFEKGLSRGIIAEINGGRSSGRTSVCLHILAQATRRGEICAVIDLYDGFHPASAAALGAQLQQLLWVRCHGNAEHAMHAADLLLHAGGFGVVLLDICEASPRVLNRIPLSYWYRFHRAIENTPTILLVCAAISQVRSSSSNKLQLRRKAVRWRGKAPFLVLHGIEADAILHKTLTVPPEALSIQTVA